VAGGYYVVQAADRAEAIALAERCPHAKWGPVEVREIMEMGPRPAFGETRGPTN
jgi:hypothetical protein